MLNPIIYVTFHQDFRRAFKYLLCLQCASMGSRLRAEAYQSQFGTTTAAGHGISHGTGTGTGTGYDRGYSVVADFVTPATGTVAAIDNTKLKPYKDERQTSTAKQSRKSSCDKIESEATL